MRHLDSRKCASVLLLQLLLLLQQNGRVERDFSIHDRENRKSVEQGAVQSINFPKLFIICEYDGSDFVLENAKARLLRIYRKAIHAVTYGGSFCVIKHPVMHVWAQKMQMNPKQKMQTPPSMAQAIQLASFAQLWTV